MEPDERNSRFVNYVDVVKYERQEFKLVHLMEDIFGPIWWIPIKTQLLVITKDIMNSSTELTFLNCIPVYILWDLV
ncbi:hypothetical protein Hanom_Chr17g01579151 [Helianthus anomalus]